MLKTVMKSSGRILACVAVVALLTGMGCINSLMFHPDFCRGGYGESTEGYVDRHGVALRMPTRAAIQLDGHRLRLIYGCWDARTRT